MILLEPSTASDSPACEHDKLLISWCNMYRRARPGHSTSTIFLALQNELIRNSSYFKFHWPAGASSENLKVELERQSINRIALLVLE